MSRISLCMIVKNEAPVIARCLRSVLPWLSAWTVVDTGSTDGTPEVVQSILGHLPGAVQHRAWVNFAHNRTEAFELNREQGDYHLVVDADDWLEFPEGYLWPELSADCYTLPVLYESIEFRRPHLFRTELNWSYVGVLHEYAYCPEASIQEHLSDIRYVCSYGQSARARNPRKFSDDAALLERALLEEPGSTRYAFYLAQSYRDAGDWEQAARAYARRAKMGGWSEEVYLSLLERGRILRRSGEHTEARSCLLEAYQVNPLRAEALVELAALHRQRRHWHLAYLFAERAAALDLPGSGLFLEPAVYRWKALDELALACFYTGRYRRALGITERLVQESSMPEPDRLRMLMNLGYCRKAAA